MQKIVFLFLTSLALNSYCQDTFSIVAADSLTREVGSAGASCVDLFQTSFTDDSFLGDLLPDTGAINSQASYIPANQTNARTRMRAGDTPAQIVSWLMANDVGSNSSVRQYGVVGFSGSNVSAMGFTGTNCMNYKNHVSGSINGIYYCIQGNILLGQMVLDSMESKFRNATGDLACRLMAAMQGAKMIGADTRCNTNNTSSLFAFLKVAQPIDAYGAPSFLISMRTHNGDSIEPIDSLQTIFNLQKSCLVSNVNELKSGPAFKLFPNPVSDDLTLRGNSSLVGSAYSITDLAGKKIMSGKIKQETTLIHTGNLPAGLYLLHVPGSKPQLFTKN